MNYSLKTRVLSMVLAVVMVIGLVPMSVFAEEVETQSTTLETVIVKFDVNGGTGEYEDQEVILGDKVTKPEEDPTHETAEFAYWTADLEENEEWNFEEDVVTGAMTLYATWIVSVEETEPEETEPEVTEPEVTEPEETKSVEATYTVQHYLETAEGYVLDETATETKSGVVGEATVAEAKIYEGYTAQPFEQGTIAADGSTVVEIMYSADPVAVDATLGGGLESIGMTIITDKESTLAPGVTMNEIVMYDSNGDRVEMYLTTSDTSVDTVKFYANYKDNQNQSYGLQTLSEQVAAMEANYEEPFKIVAGINASYYNTTTGKPTGAFVMEGIDVTTESEGNNYAFFAVLKDGTVMIGAKDDYSTYKDQIKEAIGGYVHIVKNGAVVSGLDKTTKYPRQTIGITADGKVITMTADGSQTQTIGLTYQEQAEVMLALGCVEALHLDGGNSATFGAVREGTDEFVTVNSPSGNAERAVSNTLMIVSTAVPDGTFDHAVITSEYDYFVPYSTYTFDAFGVDATNASAEIPETAVWTLSDDSFGTIENGTFVSNGTLGSVDIQLSNDGKVIGSKTINVVTPTALSFPLAETTVPYGKTAELIVSAMYGNNEAFCTADAFNFTVDPDAAGTMDGFSFTAADESSIENATVTAAYKYDSNVASASITVKFGKGSEVLFDFEDGDISDWHGIDTIYKWINEKNAANSDAKYPVIEPQDQYSNGIDKQTSSVFLASEENGGQVKSGEYSLGFQMNHLNVTDIGGWLYNYLYYTGETQVLRDVANGKTAVRIGMWVYSPDITNVAFRLVRGTETADGTKGIKYSYMISDYDGVAVSYATNYAIPEAGWIYVYYDLTDLADTYKQTTSLYDPDNNNGAKAGANYYPAFLQLFTGSATDTPEDMIFYIDDITLDYSDVTEDRDAPVISAPVVSTDGANDVALNGQTVDSNLLSFSAAVSDASGNANATGLDYTTAKIYVDGIDASGNAGFKAANGMISLNNVYLSNGQHSIAFVIFDKQGNETRLTKTLTVNGSAGNAKVYLKGRNDSNNTPEAGSVYYIDVKASEASQIEAITTTLKLNTANKFEFGNIICADGVTVTTSYDGRNFELTLKISHDGTTTGEAALVSVPIRVWAWDEGATGITAANQFATGAIPVIDIECKTTFGKVTYADGAYVDYVAGFHTELDVATKLDNASAWHTHTAAAIDDKSATCTESGYTGRTYCDGCMSVVGWGTTVAATGHTYEIGDDNILDCRDCSVTFTGVWEDGKTYVDGLCVANGWNGESYYLNGVKLTGVQKVPAPDGSGEYYYDFGDDGVCKNGAKYTGLLQEADGKYYYAKMGVLTSGWNMIDSDWYYFDTTTLAAASGSVKIGVITYEFEETGKLTSGVWVNAFTGWRYYYGPSYYHNGWQTIDGKLYYFDYTNGYRTTGIRRCRALESYDTKWYLFDENGVSQGELNGIHNNNGTLYYFEDGFSRGAGLVKVDGDYYYAYIANGQIATNEMIWITAGNTNGLLPEGNYRFGADGKMIGQSSSGIIVNIDNTLYYYKDGRPYSAGLIQLGEDFYYATDSGKLAVATFVAVTEANANKLFPAGRYYFDVEGKMIGSGAEGEIVTVNNELYYYKSGVPAKNVGLVQIGSNFYYAYVDSGKIAVDTAIWITSSNSNGLIPQGNYRFDAEGKMIGSASEGEIVTVNGVAYYYVDGKPVKGAGLVKVGEDFYYAYLADGKIAINTQLWVTEANANGHLPAANYRFDEEGKMVGSNENGEIVSINNVAYYYRNGQPVKNAGLVKVGNDYYYAYLADAKVAVNTQIWISNSNSNSLLPQGNYRFGADGKMIGSSATGEIVTINNIAYYYCNGQPVKNAGLVKVGDDYYYAYMADGKIALNTQIWVTEGNANGHFVAGNYLFDAEGKMIGSSKDGEIVEKDGTLYYYQAGKVVTGAGLIFLDNEYYYAYLGDGKIATDAQIWITEGNANGYVSAGNYRFDAEGKMIGGSSAGEIVELNGTLYYYISGQPAKNVGLFQMSDGCLYYAKLNNGELAVNCSLYISKTNGLLLERTYTFDANGRIIG